MGGFMTNGEQHVEPDMSGQVVLHGKMQQIKVGLFCCGSIDAAWQAGMGVGLWWQSTAPCILLMRQPDIVHSPGKPQEA